MIQILDIYFDNPFDAEKEKATGTDGVIVKAGQGHAIYKHTHMISECERVGLPWGVYWVQDARYNPDGHKRAIKTAFPGGDFGLLGLWMDIEKPSWTMLDSFYRLLPYKYAGPVMSVIHGVIDYSGKKPGVYTSPGAYNLILSGASVSDRDFLGTLPLWTAQYNSHISKPDLYGSWINWHYWQYQEGPDYSVFNGTDQQFYSLIGGSLPAGQRFSQTVNMGS